MKQVLVIENAPDAPVGLVGQIMEEQGIGYDVVNVLQSEIPDIMGYSAVVALGGPQHVDNYDSYPYFVGEEQLIREAIEKDIAYLGICLGGQLLAHTLGAQVGRHHTFELGFSYVQHTAEGRKDPLLQGLANPQLVFQWHVDAFALPQNAVLLATSIDTPNQALRYGRRAYGLQYHIEVLPETFALWLQEEARELVEVLGPEAISQISDGWERNYAAYRQQSTLMIGNFFSIAGLLVPETGHAALSS